MSKNPEDFDLPFDISNFAGIDDLDDFDEAAYWQEPDFLLSDLITTMVNMAGVEMGVTLIMKGMVMTGTLVSEKEYLAAITNLFTKQAKQALPEKEKTEETLKETEEAFDFTTMAEGATPAFLDKDSNDDDVSLVPLRYLHLKDPAIISPQPAITFMHSELPIMRVRLNMVDGWLLGRAAPMEDVENNGGNPGEVLH